MSKRTEITVEIERLVVVSKGSRKPRRAFCELCEKETEMLTTDGAARFAKCSSWAIFGWVGLGWLHFTETDEGILLVCRNSLGNLLKIK
jgi:hypothetical protein